MTRRAIFCLTAALMLLIGLPGPGMAQQPPTVAVGRTISDIDGWGARLETGLFWGQFFGGLSAITEKKSFKKIRAEIMDNTRRVTIRPTIDAIRFAQGGAGSAPHRQGWGTYLAPVGAVQLSNFGFGNGDGFSVGVFLGGGRIVLPRQPSFQAYVQFLAGLEHSFGENAFAFEPGGGVIIPVNSFLLTAGAAVRHASYAGDSESTFELNVGITVPIGRKP